MREVRSFGPSHVDEHNVMKWCREAREFEGTVQGKALDLARHDCMKYLSPGVYLSLPLNTKDEIIYEGKAFKKIPYSSNYNKSDKPWTIVKEGKVMRCNCLGFHTKEKRGELQPGVPGCAHILALLIAFKLKKFTREEGSTSELEAPDPMDGEVKVF